MQIFLIILQLITIAILLFVIRQNKRLKELLVETSNDVGVLIHRQNKLSNKTPLFLVIKQWFDTGNATTAMVEADSKVEAYNQAIDDDFNEKYTIINIIEL